MSDAQQAPKPIKPYLINAVLDYCRDNGATPYVMVEVDDCCRLPQEYVRDNRIVFDISDEATNRLEVGNDWLRFQGRFGENNEIMDIAVPLNRIIAVTPLEYQEFALRFEVTETPASVSGKKTAPGAAPARRPMRVK